MKNGQILNNDAREFARLLRLVSCSNNCKSVLIWNNKNLLFQSKTETEYLFKDIRNQVFIFSIKDDLIEWNTA